MASLVCILYVVSLCTVQSSSTVIDTLVVQTQYGNVRGFSKNVLGTKLYVFYGIPFAQPPTGDRRFRKPVPAKPWYGVLDATKPPNSCVQQKFEYFPGFQGEEMWNPNTPVSEDCLYLNIWVPASILQSNQYYPVLAWIYGGGYMSGTSTLEVYDASILAAKSDLIVTSMQYRVGAFGFFYQGSLDAPGNMGLYDQAMALQWIKDNIASFHGDGEEITVFGESAGAGSVSTHLISPVSRHIPKRAVLQSGAINAPWSSMSPQKSLQISEKLIEDCGCRRPTYKSRMRCMQSIPANNISLLQWNSYWGILGFPSAPTVDGEFLPRDPWEMLKDGDFSKIDIIIGTNQDEGTFFILYDFLEYFEKDNPSFLSRENFFRVTEQIFSNQWPHPPIQIEAIKYQYTDWDQVQDGYLNQKMIGDLVGDFFFVCPCNYFAMQYAEHGSKVFYYYFNHRTSSNPWGDWMGVLHGDEIEYVFGVPLNSTKRYTKDEISLSTRIMKHYETFAKYGTPVFDKDDHWPLYHKDRPQFYIWNANIKGTGNGPRALQCAFWNQFMPKLTGFNKTVKLDPGDCAVTSSSVSGQLLCQLLFYSNLFTIIRFLNSS